MTQSISEQGSDAAINDEGISLRELFAPVGQRWKLWLTVTLAAGAIGAAGSYLITPHFTSETTFLPPQQQQSAAASALSSLGALAGLAGGGTRSPAEQFVSLMQSVTATDRMIDRFHLVSLYDAKFRRDARKTLLSRTLVTVGKKDGLITVSVEDESPQRAADMANQYVDELRRLTSVLAVSEAQQRRVFFEKQMQDTKARLVTAQSALQQSGFTADAIKTEPRAAADQYAQLRAQATAADVRLQTLRASMTESSPEVQQQAATLESLRSKLLQLESATTSGKDDPDYISKYREFKYQETLFDILSKQYELARVDESHEGALIQVVDPAVPAEVKSSPKRSLIAVGCALLGALAMAAWLIVRRPHQPT